MLSKEPVLARAHTNIAVIKYWGKADEKIIIPQSSSLSLTLKEFYTDTAVKFLNDLKQDQIRINHQRIPVSKKIMAVLNLVRKLANTKAHAVVNSVNHVPTSAGLASSASGLSALALASSYAAGLRLSKQDLSRLARHGSGSASRSIFGGWVEWQRGHDNHSSYAFPIKDSTLNDVDMIAIIIKKTPKKISSRQGMRRSVKTSPYYGAWKEMTAKDLTTAVNALQNDDFRTLGHVAETNAMRMHALTLSADPPFMYFNGDTIKIIDLINDLQAKGVNCYYTIDAGPNVKVICQHCDSLRIKRYLSKFFNPNKIVISGPGPGAHLIQK
ncbi:diphosphomevalonate decarboxylase [uncultured bacterium]|nr:diphosphomevalonate decarboxylase [uncultured bacterium]